MAQTAFVQFIPLTVLVGAAITVCGALVAFFFAPRRISTQAALPPPEPQDALSREPLLEEV